MSDTKRLSQVMRLKKIRQDLAQNRLTAARSLERRLHDRAVEVEAQYNAATAKKNGYVKQRFNDFLPGQLTGTFFQSVARSHLALTAQETHFRDVLSDVLGAEKMASADRQAASKERINRSRKHDQFQAYYHSIMSFEASRAEDRLEEEIAETVSRDVKHG